MRDFFWEYKWWLVVALVIPLVTTYVCFTCDGPIPTGGIDKGTWLSFWGGFLAFYGTFFLGMVTIWQGRKAEEQNKRLLDIEYSRQSCNIVLKDSDSVSNLFRLQNENGVFGDSLDIQFHIINHGDAILKKLKIQFSDNLIFSSYMILAKGESKDAIVQIPKVLACSEKAKVFFVSCNDVTTHGDIDISFAENNRAKMTDYHFYGLERSINNE